MSWWSRDADIDVLADYWIQITYVITYIVLNDTRYVSMCIASGVCYTYYADGI